MAPAAEEHHDSGLLTSISKGTTMLTTRLFVPVLLAAPLASQVITNTIPHAGPFVGAVAYDAVTNEVVVIDQTAVTVTFYDRATGLQMHQYPAPASLPIGGQIDITTGRLWLVGENEIVYEIDRSGIIVGSWSCAPTINDASALAMDPFTNTIWISNDSAHIVAEFTRTGVATGSQFVPVGSTDGDGLAYDPSAARSCWARTQRTRSSSSIAPAPRSRRSRLPASASVLRGSTSTRRPAPCSSATGSSHRSRCSS